MNITVIDAPCGAGKTSWAIQEMNNNRDKSFIYCTPFLDEISRVRDACCKARFREPQPFNGSKLDDFNSLLADGADIAVTHTTFLNATNETLENVRQGEYTLICDEALQVVMDFNELQAVESSPRQQITADDIRFLIDKQIIEVTEGSRVTWRGGNTGTDFKFDEVRKMAELSRLYCTNGVFFVVVYPTEIFKAFDRVFILTYQFGGSLMKYFFDMFKLSYSMASITKSCAEYSLTEYTETADLDFRERCRQLITLCDDTKLNEPRRKLTHSWYENASSESISELKSNLRSYFRSYAPKALASSKMWTCFKPYKDKLKDRGYTAIREITRAEKEGLSKEELRRLEQSVSCFVPCNARSTNSFRERWILAYLCNLFPNPFIKKFFTDAGIIFDDDAYALSNLIQWICRSRLRDGLPIYLYLPSERERRLFTAWCEGGVHKRPQKVQ